MGKGSVSAGPSLSEPSSRHPESPLHLREPAPPPASPSHFDSPLVHADSPAAYRDRELRRLARTRPILAGLETKLALVTELREIIETTEPDTPLGEIRRRFAEFRSGALEVIERLDPDASRAIREGREQRRSLAERQRAYTDLTKPDPGDAFERPARYVDRGNARFVLALEDALSSLLRKQLFVERVKKAPEPLHKELRFVCGFPPASIVRYDFAPFGVNVVIDLDKVPKRYREDYQGRRTTLGIHPTGTALNISFVKDPEESSTVMAHEQVHNLLDSLRPFRLMLPDNGYRGELKRVAADIRAGKFEGDPVRYLEKFHPKRLLSLSHEELLAEFELARDELGRLPSDWGTLSPEQANRSVRSYFGKLSTAGINLRATLRNIERFSDRLAGSDAAEAGDDIVFRTRKGFRQAVESLRCALFVAERSGDEDLVEQVRSASLVLRPSQWKFLGTYLRGTLDSEKVRESEEMFRALSYGPVTHETRAHIARILAEDSSSEDIEERVGDRLRQSYLLLREPSIGNGDVLAALAIRSPADLPAAREALRSAAELAELPHLGARCLALLDRRAARRDQGCSGLGFLHRARTFFERFFVSREIIDLDR